MRRIASLSSAVVLILGGPALPASALTPLSPDATFDIDGHGWGHARGMGQWGARGLAEAGKSFSQILTAYYTGVALTSRAAEDIRVLLEESAEVVVTSQGTFTVSWSSGAPAAASDATWRFFRVRRSASGYVVERAAAFGGPWEVAASGTDYAVFSPASSSMLELVFDSGFVRVYAGRIIARVGGSESLMRAINELQLEDYLNGVVPREMPSSWPAEALKAQAVAARTYAVYKKDSARANGTMFDICATTSCQVYSGFGHRTSPGATLVRDQTSSATAAAQATAGRILTYNGSPILAEYSSSTGGYSTPGSVPYERAVPDPGDAGSPHHTWKASVSVSEIEARWPSIGRLVSVQVTRRNGYGDWGGRVLDVQLVGTQATATVSGNAFRSAFEWPERSNGVRSDWFRIGQVVPPNIGVRRDNVWYLRTADGTRTVAYGRSTDRPLVGDWDGDGTDGIGVFRSGSWYLDFNADGRSERAFAWGRSTDRPVTGDWDGNGTDTLGLVRDNVWYLDTNGDGRSDVRMAWGRSTDAVITGDWDGNGADGIGLIRDNVWYLDNNLDGRSDLVFRFGSSTDRPVVGDWDQNGSDTPGVVRDSRWYLDNGNDGSGADVTFAYGRSTDVPLIGGWTRP